VKPQLRPDHPDDYAIADFETIDVVVGESIVRMPILFAYMHGSRLEYFYVETPFKVGEVTGELRPPRLNASNQPTVVTAQQMVDIIIERSGRPVIGLGPAYESQILESPATDVIGPVRKADECNVPHDAISEVLHVALNYRRRIYSDGSDTQLRYRLSIQKEKQATIRPPRICLASDGTQTLTKSQKAKIENGSAY
jgi:hypothetical protein